jgi:hypothetical protein
METTANNWLNRKLAKAGILLGLVGYCWAAPGWADELPSSRYTPQQRQQLLLTQAEVPAPPAPGAVPAPAPMTEAAAAPAAPAELPGDCAPQGASCCDPAAEEEEMWSLTSIFDDGCGGNWMTDNGLKVGGSTVQSFTWNWSSPNDRFNGPVTWTDRSNEYQLNQQWLYLEKATDTSENDLDVGGRVDINYGTNYRWMTSAGLEDRWSLNTNRSFYGLAIPQMYGEVAYKDVKVKAGHFASPVGYLGLDMSANAVNTLPYTYQYGEAFTHTGAIATWQVSENLSVGSGFTRGWDNWDGSGAGSPNLGYIGTANYTIDECSSLALVVLWSREWNNKVDGDGNIDYSGRYLQTLVYQRKLSEELTWVFQTDYGHQGNTADFSGARDIGDSDWYGINQYLLWQQTDKVTWVGNFEWFRDENGYRVGPFLPTPTTPGSATRGLAAPRFGYAGNFYQVTVGPKWMPTKNLYIRPNLRFDWYSGESLNPDQSKPFGDGNKSGQALLATDVGFVY